MSKSKLSFKISIMFAILCISNSIPVLATSDSVIEQMEIEIDQSVILDENDYTIKEVSVEELPEGIVPLQFDTVEQAIKYLEEYEESILFDMSDSSCITDGAINPQARATRTYDCKYERKLTSCYTLSATVDVDDSTKKILDTYNQKFELSGVTIGIGIDNVDIETEYLSNQTEVKIRAEYQHVTYALIKDAWFEIGRSNCYQQMYYTFDDQCHDGEFGYR